VAVLTHAGVAVAADPPTARPEAAKTPPSPEEPDAEPGAKRPAAPDERSGHIYISAQAAATGPAGSVSAGVPSSTVAGAGLTVGGTVGVGLGRHAILQAFADGSFYSNPGECPGGCQGRGYTVGLGLSYHLAQGIAFDPWGSFGVAFRSSSYQAVAPMSFPAAGNSPAIVAGAITDRSYKGIDVARIAFGGDFYPHPLFGFGPYVEGDFGTNFLIPRQTFAFLPAGASDGPRTYAYFHVGVRIVLDPIRRGSAPARSSTAGASPRTPPPGI
jgi:hypothetical protein